MEKIYNRTDLKIFQKLVLIGIGRNKMASIRLLGVGVRFLDKEYEQLELTNFDM